MTQYEKGIFIIDFLQSLGMDMIDIGYFIDDKNLEKSFKIINDNTNISIDEFKYKMMANKLILSFFVTTLDVFNSVLESK